MDKGDQPRPPGDFQRLCPDFPVSRWTYCGVRGIQPRLPGGHIVEHAGFEPASWTFPVGFKSSRNQDVPLGGGRL